VRLDPRASDWGESPFEQADEGQQDEPPPGFRRADEALTRRQWGAVTILDPDADDIDF
jgi:hypothetical protein